jgi:hypothetical protein
MLVALHTSFAIPQLQHEIHPQWQMTGFCISNINGNGIIEIS